MNKLSDRFSHAAAWPHWSRLAMVATWVLVTITLLALLAQGVRDADRFDAQRSIPSIAYVAMLLCYLARTGPSVAKLPEVRPVWAQRWPVVRLLPPLGLAILLALNVLSDDGGDLSLFFMIAATLWILLVWRREIRLRTILLSLGLAGIAFLAGLPIWLSGFASRTVVILLPVFSFPMFVAGSLLLERTKLGTSQLYVGQYGSAFMSFVKGCVLFVPLGLMNAADGSPGGGVEWVNQAWMPVALPFFSGITEEVWFRLLLVGLSYYLLRPALAKRPGSAVVCALLFSAIVFGLGHGRTLERFLTTGLMYGLPLATAFAKRDWEHAAGGHYMINMVPWTMAFLES